MAGFDPSLRGVSPQVIAPQGPIAERNLLGVSRDSLPGEFRRNAR